MVRNDLPHVFHRLLADTTDAALLDNFTMQQEPHGGTGSNLPIAAWNGVIFDSADTAIPYLALDAELLLLAAAAIATVVNRARLISS